MITYRFVPVVSRWAMLRRVLVSLVFFTALVPAQSQVLSQVEVIRESTYGIDGLVNTSAVTISPDGAHVYAVSDADNGVAAFTRTPGTGALTFVEVERQGVAGVQGLDGANAVTVAPDGNHVYVTGDTDGTVAVFSRNAGTGALTFVEAEQDNVGGVDGLRGAVAVSVSPDNAHVYVAGRDEDAIVIFSRDLGTGALTYVSTVFNNAGGVTGLNRIQDVLVASNGADVYAVSDFDDTVVAFRRDAGTGALTFLEQEKNGVGGVLGLDGATAVTLAGANLYVASNVNNAVAVFFRNLGTGEITFSTLLVDGSGGVDGLLGARDIVVAPNGSHVYVAGELESEVAIFTRNSVNGSLAYSAVIQNGIGGVQALAQPTSLIVSPDDAHVYTTSVSDSALAVFTRTLATGALAFSTSYRDSIGLELPLALAIAPDGEDVYVTDATENAISQFSRNTSDGTLSYAASLIDDQGGVDGLLFALGVAVSPDNKHVYATGRMDDTVSAFSRNSTTGALSFVQALRDNNQGGAIDGLDDSTAVLVSPDGGFVYVGSGVDAAIDVFSRNPTTGVLTFVEMIQQGTDGVQGLAFLTSLAFAPNATHLYAVGTFDDTLAVFSRDAGTGHLTFLEVFEDGVGGVDGLADPTSLVVSPEGNSVYVAALADDAVSIFSRNTTSGALTYQGQIKDGVGGIVTLDGARGVDVSPDGTRVYVTSTMDNALNVFSRDVSTGALTLMEAHVHGVSGIDGLAGATDVAQSPDAAFVYVTGSTTGSLAVFERLEDLSVPPPPVIITNGGANFTVGITPITVRGTTSVVTQQLRLNGIPIVYTPGSTTWQTQVDISSGLPVTMNFTAFSGIVESTASTIEITYSANSDYDGDTLPDSGEGEADTDGDGTPNYMDPDSDGDEIEDSLEAELGSDPFDAVNHDTVSAIGVPWYVDSSGAATRLPPRDGGTSTLVFLHNNRPDQIVCLIEYYTQEGVYIGPMSSRTFTIEPNSSVGFRPVADDPDTVVGGQEAAQGRAVPNRPTGTANGNDNKKNGSFVVRWIGGPFDVQGESTTYASANDIGPHTSAYLLPPGFISTPGTTAAATDNSIAVPWYVDNAGTGVRFPPRDGAATTLVYLHNNKSEPITCDVEYYTQDGVYIGPFGTLEKQFTIPANASLAFRPVADDPSTVLGGQEAEGGRAIPNRPQGTANGNDNKKNGSIVFRWSGAPTDVQGFCTTASTVAGLAVVTAQNPNGLAPHAFSYLLPAGLSADDLAGPSIANALNVPWYVDSAGAAQKIPPRDNGTSTLVYLHNNRAIAVTCTIEYYTQDGIFVGPSAPSNEFQIPANSSIAFRPAINDPSTVVGGQEAAVGAAVPNRPLGTANGNDNKKNGSIVIRWNGRPGDIQGVGSIFANAPDLGPHTNAFLLPSGFPTPLSGSAAQSVSVPWYVDNAGVGVRVPPRDGNTVTLIYLHNNRATDLECAISYYTQDGVFIGPAPGANSFTIPANASVAFRPVADDPATVPGGQEGVAGLAVPNRPLGTANGNDNKKNGSVVIRWTGSVTDVQGVCSSYGSPAGMEPATEGNPEGMAAYSFSYLLPTGGAAN